MLLPAGGRFGCAAAAGCASGVAASITVRKTPVNRAVSKYLLFILTLFFSIYYFECFRQYLFTRNYSGRRPYFP